MGSGYDNGQDEKVLVRVETICIFMKCIKISDIQVS